MNDGKQEELDMRTMRAFRIEQEFRRKVKYGSSGQTEVQWQLNASPHMDGLTFKEGYIMVSHLHEGSPTCSLTYHHGGFRPYTVMAIDEDNTKRLINEKLIRELV